MSHMPSNGSYVALAFCKSCRRGNLIWGINFPNWHWYRPKNIEPTWTLTKYMSTDIGPGPTILSRCRRFLPRRCNQYQPTWSQTEYLQQTLGIPQYLSGTNHLSCQTSRILPNLPKDAVATWFIFCQLTLVTPSIFSNQRQGFQTRRCGSSGAIWNIGSCRSSFLHHACQKLFSLVSLKDCLYIFSRIFIVVWPVHPLNVKITVTGWSYPFRARTPINPYD